MKKIIVSLILITTILFAVLIIILSTVGIETNKFNKLISEKAYQKNIKLELETIQFKIDPKGLSLFIETKNPKITYKELSLPSRSIKLYIDFFSLLKSNPVIKKISLSSEELDISQVSKLSKIIKPSNFKSILNNRIKKGKLIFEVEIFLKEDGLFENFITTGTVKNLNAKFLNDVNLTKTNFNFFADQNDILVKNIFGDLADIKISEGYLKLNLEDGVKIDSNFYSKIDYNKKLITKYSALFGKNIITQNLNFLKADLNNNLSINLDNTYKVKNYKYNFSGQIKKSKIELLTPFQNDLFKNKIKEILFSNFEIESNLSPKKISLKGNGKYSFNGSDFLNLNFENLYDKDLMNLKLNFDYKDSFELELINFKKDNDTLANFSIDFDKKNNIININKFDFKEGDNLLKIRGLNLKNNKFLSFDKIQVALSNNDFLIQNGKKIFIKGTKFDATNLIKFLTTQSDENKLQKLNGDIEIDFKNIKVPMSEKLENFRLIGEIRKGQFVKITSKGDFGGNNFLDVSMKRNKNSNKKYLEVYSDLTRPLLSEYSFFNGLAGGKLLFTSIIDGSKSNSKLNIQNFKVVNAPGVIRLLSLADLGGLADLAEGEGLSFDLLEIKMEKTEQLLKLNEILALGPSMSVLMDGYQSSDGLTSLRGTLVPAKTLNKIISKIPILGDIVIPKEIGEGLFGISFKMKGPKGKIKTSINPIRTITPRFIQKIVDRKKEVK